MLKTCSSSVNWLFLLGSLLLPAPLLASSTLIFPRASFDPNLITGIAIANPTGQDAAVTITAYGVDGQPLSGAGMQNPAQITVPADQQVARISADLFGVGVDPSTVAWLLAASPTDGLTGFFLLINSSITLLDGADLPVTSQKLVFNSVRVDASYTTEINLVNPGDSTADLQIQLAGISPAPIIKELSIPAKAVVRLDAATFFQTNNVSPGAYIIINSSIEVAGFELVRNGSADGIGFNARRFSEKLSTLYFLQVSVLGPYKAQLGVVNYSANPVVLTISASKPDGTLFDFANLQNNPITRTLPAGGSLREDVQSMFGFFGDKPLDCWLTVKSTSEAINGYMINSNPTSGAEAGVTSGAQGRVLSLFSHIATAPPYYTGLAVLNPSSLAANLRFVALKPTGEILGSYDTVLPPGQTFNKLLGSPDFIADAAGQAGGLVWVKSNIPVYAASNIGSDNAASNIPAQDVPDSYAPDSSLTTLKLVPPIAIVPPSVSQKFQIAAGVSATWKVNGTIGGSASVGVITNAGVYTAPKTIPARQVVTITAESSNQSAGASADILDKRTMVGDLSVVQSVAYMSSLRKIYAAELAALSAPVTAQMAPGVENAAAASQIYEVSPITAQTLVATYADENIVKILPFIAVDGNEYLLLLAQTTGRIIRLNPVTKNGKDVATGLNQPTSMVFDPVSGDLLVVEKDKISTVPKASLQSDLSSSAPSAKEFAESLEFGVRRLAGVNITGAAGIAMDRCTGKIYLSMPDSSSIVEYDPLTNSTRIVISDLQNPGQLLGIYRTGVTCPDSFQLLVAERGADRVDLVVPSSGISTVWSDAPGIRDLAFTRSGNAFTAGGNVLLASYTLQNNGVIYIVPITELYDNNPPNPPITALLDRKTDIAVTQTSSPHEAPPGSTVTYTANVTNLGPLTATGVVLIDTLPSGTTFVSASTTLGSCTQAGGSGICNIGFLSVKGSATVTIKVSINNKTQPGKINNTVDVSAAEIDPDPTNNHAAETTTVLQPVAVNFVVTGPSQSPIAGESFAITAAAVDAAGNVVTGYRGKVHFISSDFDAALPPNYTFTAADNGSHTFGNVRLVSSGDRTISVSELGTASPISGSLNIQVIAGAASRIWLSGFPGNKAVAGSLQNLTVAIRDANGNLADSFSGPVHFTSTDPQAVLPADRVLSPYDHAYYTYFGIVLKTAGNQTITVTATSASSAPQSRGGVRQASQGINATVLKGVISVLVTPAGASSFTVTPSTSTPAAGAAFNVTVTAKDAFGNIATDYSGQVGFSASPADPQGTLPPNYTFVRSTDNGTHTFSVTFKTAGNRSVTVTDLANRSITGSSSVIVNPGALDNIALSPVTATIAAGGSQAYTATGYDQYNNSLGNVTSATTFSISPDGSCTGATCTASVAGPHIVTGNDSGKTATATLTVTAGALDHIVLSPATATIPAGGSQTYTATGYDPYNNSLGNVTSATTFSISPDGSCTGATCTATVPGLHTVTGNNGGKTATATLNVTAGALNRIVLSPATATITAGGSQTYTATGYDPYNNSLGNVTSSTTFTISPDGSCTGATCTATIAGSHTVTGNDAGKTATATLNVTAGALNRIVLSPATATITAGGSQTYTATGFDQSNNSLGDVTGATTFTIAPDGSCTGATCTATVPGLHTVTGNNGGKTATATLNVTAGQLDYIVLSPANATITAGGNQTYTATGFDQSNSSLGDVTGGTTFTIAPNGSCTGATCTATVPGLHAVTGNNGGKTATATLNVTAGQLDHIVLSPANATIAAGGSQAYTATGFDQSNNSLGDVTGGTTFTISPDGSCTGATCTATVPGLHTITGNNGGKTATATLNVTAGQLDHIVLSPATATISPGGSQTYTAMGFDQNNNSLGNVTSATTFSISPDGSCTGATCTASVAGPHIVTGNDSGKTATATLTVGPGSATGFTVSPNVTSVASVDSTSLSITVTAKDAFGNTATGYGGTVRFTSSDAGASLPSSSTLTNGTGSFSVTLKTYGSQTITATDSVNQSVTGTSSSIQVRPHHFEVAFGGQSPYFTFNPTPVTVTAVDALGSPLTSYTGTVHFTTSDTNMQTGDLPSNYQFLSSQAGCVQLCDDGSHTFTVIFRTVGNQSITVTDTVATSITGTAQITLSPGGF